VTITLGIDLASQPERTALALMSWSVEGAQVVTLVRGGGPGGTLHDKRLVSAMQGLAYEPDAPTKVAIDAPFGWPEPFVEAVVAHQHGAGWPDTIDNPRAKYERRFTDLHVKRETGKLPLSVSTDRIAYCAMRCAVLLADLARFVGPEGVARDGSGLVAEVYPDPALRRWLPALWGQADKDSYKGKTDKALRRRAALVDGLLAACDGRLGLSEVDREACIQFDDCLDAVVCALVARAAELEFTELPSGDDARKLARLEGWIHLPPNGHSLRAMCASN
jgi:hypothetical protein